MDVGRAEGRGSQSGQRKRDKHPSAWLV